MLLIEATVTVPAGGIPVGGIHCKYLLQAIPYRRDFGCSSDPSHFTLILHLSLLLSSILCTCCPTFLSPFIMNQMLRRIIRINQSINQSALSATATNHYYIPLPLPLPLPSLQRCQRLTEQKYKNKRPSQTWKTLLIKETDEQREIFSLPLLIFFHARYNNLT